MKAIEEVQETNLFLDAKAGILVSVETTLMFVLVAAIFDRDKFDAIKEMILSLPGWNSWLIILYYAVYLGLFIVHILYTVKVLSPIKNPQDHVQMDGFKPAGLFFLRRNRKSGKVEPTMQEYSRVFSSFTENDIMNELIFEFMKLSFIRDTKSDRVQASLKFLKFLIVGILVFGIVLVLSY